MTDNIFETTALAHVACAPQESGVLLTDFGAAYPSGQSFLDLLYTGLPAFLCRILRNIYRDTITREQNEDNYGQKSTTILSCEWFPSCNGP